MSLAKLKQLVAELEHPGDDLEFDRRLAEIDLVIYNLRQECFVLRREYYAPKIKLQDILPIKPAPSGINRRTV